MAQQTAAPTSTFKILVADEIDLPGLGSITENKRFRLVPIKDQARLEEEIVDAHALLVRSKTKVNPPLIEVGKKLKFIGRAGVGVDNIDVHAASKKGIVVANVPGGNTISAAEHTMALILALSRNIPQSHASVMDGKWERKKFIGSELQGKSLGLIGFGRIGKEVAKRALSFEMKISAYDPFVSEQHMKSMGILPEKLDVLLKNSDYISLHMPVTENTKKIINGKSLSKMKPEARLINCARGELIDEAALLDTLQKGKIKAAALDVYHSEPPKNTDLFKLKNVILTPHLGASTEEAQAKVSLELSSALQDFFEKGIIRNAVNLPSVEPEILEKISPHIQLTEKLGKFIIQIIEGGIREIKVEFAGDFSNTMRNLLSLSAVKGILSAIIGERDINWVNAIPIAKERGILIEETSKSVSEDYTALITLKIKTDKQSRSVSGTILVNGNSRIVRIDDLSVDVIPEGHLLVFTNIDRPGVVGYVGTVLGESRINIAEFQVGRKVAGGEAVSILNVDSPISEAVMKKIHDFPGITHTWLVSL